MEELLKQIEDQFGPKFAELNSKAEDLAERLESASDPEDRKAVTQRIESLEATAQSLTAEREAALADAERKAMAARIGTLESTIENLRQPGAEFLGGASGSDEKSFYEEGKSFYQDALSAMKGDPAARDRWEQALGGKAMTEGTGSAGGYLVPDEVSSELLALRQQDAVLRGLFSRVDVQSDTLRIASVTGGLSAGWVAELAAKPSSDMTFAEISAGVFTAAGLAIVSNQLLADATRSIDTLINSDLAKRLRNLEEVAFINGTGSGQPTGILGTSGVQTETLTSTDIEDLLDAVVNSITKIHTNFLGAPNAIVMHPRTWARIVKARNATSGQYIYTAPGSAINGRSAQDAVPGYGSAQTPRGDLFGLPVYTTANVPTNLGTGTDESRIIVGKFDEALILDRQGITLDRSEHVYFTSNQTVFRAEERVGFTAGRYPKAFCVVQGAGLAGG
jgi:HK97 family phage major capsid protein